MDLADLNKDNFVAHYTSLDTAVRYILPAYKIRVSSVGILNDPYENTADWIQSEATLGFNFDFQKSVSLSKIKQKAINHIKVFSTTAFEEQSDNYDITKHIYCRPRMWAQYGDNHKGVCLIFDKNELEKAFSLLNPIAIKSNKVDYPPFMESTDCNIDPSKFRSILNDPHELYEALNHNYIMEHRFFRKHSDWKNENEYRWLLFMEQMDDVYVYCEKALKVIVF